ncbi:MAG: histidinol-phosphate transaminase [Gammaproteobacteria bacterium]|nr:histidinol-phosphate transaminase [Gammaproteobacteria bacterium]
MNFERENIRRMAGYTSGEQPDNELVIKLNTNENPYPPSPQVSEVLRQFNPESLRRYPPATAQKFRQLAAELHGLDPGNVIATRGGDELLRLVITTFVDPGEKIGMTDPTYSLYPVLAQIQNCPIVEMPLMADWSLPAEFAQSMNDAKVKLTFLVNPHAPTGVLMPIDQVSNLASELNSILLLDEAYINFVDHDYQTSQLIKQHDNLVILRTLSKGYSLAGLRFGYGLADHSLIEPMLNKTRDSYNLDFISQLIAEAAIADQDYVRGNWRKVIIERNRLKVQLHELGIICAESQANFLLATIPESINSGAAELYQQLKERQILVRYFNAARLGDKLRISVGTQEENNQLLSAIKGLVDQH